MGGQSASLPTSPVESRNITPIATHTEAPASTVPPAQESGVVTSPTESGKAAQAAPAQGLAAPNQNTGLARSSSGAGDGKHYHSGPATNELGEREYVAKQ